MSKEDCSPAIGNHEDVAAHLDVEDLGEGYSVTVVARIAVKHDNCRAGGHELRHV